MSIKICFNISDLGMNNINACIMYYARCNKFLLKNESIISYQIQTSKDIENNDMKHLIEAFTIFKYNNTAELDELLYLNNVNIFYSLTNNNTNILPTLVPSCIHSIQNVTPYGDIFFTIDNVPLMKDPIDCLTKDITQIDNSSSENFNQKFIIPALKIIPSFGYKLNEHFSAIFIGNKQDQQKIVIIDLKNISSINNTTSDNIALNNTIVNNTIADSTIEDNTADNTVADNTADNTVVKRYRIKLLCNWATSSELKKCWNKMSYNSTGLWDKPVKIEIVDGGHIDYYVIINRPIPGDHYEVNKTIVFRMEPYIDDILFYNDWLINVDKNKFIYFLDNLNFRNNTEWWLSSNPTQLNLPITKNKLFSTIVSSQYKMKGHKLRIDFIKYLQANSELELDVYGNDNNLCLENYKGSLPNRSKDDGIFPYKYHFTGENSDIDNYITEKFYDAIIGECLVFYWGCGNIHEHINPECFIKLDLTNQEASLKIIETAIKDDEWSKRINIIRNEKSKIINSFNFFPRVSSLLYSHNFVQYNYIIYDSISINIPGIIISQKINKDRIIDHINIWKKCILDNKVNCVFEYPPKVNFLDHLTVIYSNIPKEWDIIYLSSCNDKQENILKPLVDYTKMTKTMSAGYIISTNGAKKLINIVNKGEVISSIDKFILNNNLKAYIPWRDFLE
jgi:GR25 family glycosyltransferase involved in LPS biosynthesis